MTAFYSAVKEKRPVRLCEATRQFAKDSLDGVYGRICEQTPAVCMDNCEGFDTMDAYEKYNAMILKIATEAPVRLVEGELLSGSATLGQAIFHFVPATFGGEVVQESVSHLTMGFSFYLRAGVDAYERHLEERLREDLPADKRRVLVGIRTALDAMHIWHKRYLEALDEKIEASEGTPRRRWQRIKRNLMHLPFGKPQSFYEAVQMLWFLFAFVRLCGNWPGLGRIDEMLGEYLKADLDRGVITKTEAREILAHFFIKGCEWVRMEETLSGDAQHYQNIVLGGIDRDGKPVENDVTYLVLEVLEELPISDFPVAVRIGETATDRLYELIARNVRHGGGVVAVYNETLIINSLVEFGYELREARRFANDGCWEVQIPGETCFTYQPFDGYRIFQERVLMLGEGKACSYSTFETLYQAYHKALGEHIREFHKKTDSAYSRKVPSGVVDLFTRGCLEKAQGYFDHGPVYSVCSPHIGGLPDIANSMYVIKKLVYEERKLTLGQFWDILRNNWENGQSMRARIRREYRFFGNDNDEVDAIATRLLDDYITLVRKVKLRNGILRPPGVSTFGRQIEWKESRYAHAHGFTKGEVLASNLSPTPSTDEEGVTAVIKSHCKLHLEQLTCGTALDIKLSPTVVDAQVYGQVIPALVQSFVELGGFFMQLDVVDNKVLLEAQVHPENFGNLSVRISGWSARFVTLSRPWQDMIIQRTIQSE